MFAPDSRSRTVFCSFLTTAMVLSCWLMPGEATAQRRRGPEAPSLSKLFREVVAQPSQSTARVRCDGKDVALGTVVGADGWILTKYSELTGPVTCILKDGRELSARVVGVHEAYDLALLKVDARNLKPVQWGDIKSALVGNFVATPEAGAEKVAAGVISVAARKVTARDLPPLQGNSGYLGIALETGENGVKVSQVLPGTAAAKAGIRTGDLVVAVAGKAVTEPNTLITTIQRYKVGEEVAIRIKRGDEKLELKVVLGKRQGTERADFQNRLGNELSNRRGGFPSILQHDTVLKPHDCGGPLVDLDGKTVGINIARAGRVETYAVPADVVQALLPELKSGKLAPPERKVAEEKVESARVALSRFETVLKQVEKRIKEAKSAADKEKAEAERQEALKHVKNAQVALEKAQAELKAWK